MADKPKLLFLDDRSNRIHKALERYSSQFKVTIVTNVIECLYFMSREDWDYISLDHDLGGKEFVDPDEPTSGMEIVRYLEKTAWPPERKKPLIVAVHSSNSFAATAMVIRLQKLGFNVGRMKF
jgi:hypothetical protein